MERILIGHSFELQISLTSQIAGKKKLPKLAAKIMKSTRCIEGKYGHPIMTVS